MWNRIRKESREKKVESTLIGKIESERKEKEAESGREKQMKGRKW